MNAALYRDPVLLDPVRHRQLRITPLHDFAVMASLHAVFLAAGEFAQAALDYAIVFVDSGERGADGGPTFSPIVLLGLTQGENLIVDGARWDARYIPAFLRRYPFLTGKLEGRDAPGVLIDRAWSGFSETQGDALFDDAGQPAPALQQAIRFLELFEAEALRTRAFCQRIAELGLLKNMKADATLPDGTALSVDGFYTVDEEKLQALPDASVLELHRNGMTMLMQLHLLSLGNLRQLLDRKAKRTVAVAAGTS